MSPKPVLRMAVPWAGVLLTLLIHLHVGTAAAATRDLSLRTPGSSSETQGQELTSNPASSCAAGTLFRDANTVGISGGPPGGSSLAFAHDLARLVASGQETGPNGEMAVRVLTIAGRGGLHDIRDVLSANGVDMAITHENLLAQLKASTEGRDIGKRLAYVARLFYDEFHVVAGPGIGQVSDLAGKTVNFGEKDSSTEAIATDVFRALKVPVAKVNLEQDDALERVRRGEIAATAILVAKPAAALSGLTRESGLHLLSIPFEAEISETYLPSTLRSDDYPNLVPAGAAVDALAVRTVLVARDLPKGSTRYRLMQSFVELLFPRLLEARARSRNGRWQEISLTEELPGWRRFKPAEDWIRRSIPDATTTSAAKRPESKDPVPSEQMDPEAERLFGEFMRWYRQQGRR